MLKVKIWLFFQRLIKLTNFRMMRGREEGRGRGGGGKGGRGENGDRDRWRERKWKSKCGIIIKCYHFRARDI